MGKVKASATTFAGKLEEAVKDRLRAVGIKATTMTERVQGTKLVRLFVMAPAFEKLSPSERQNLVWQYIADAFSRDEQMKISVVIALSKKELGPRLSSELAR